MCSFWQGVDRAVALMVRAQDIAGKKFDRWDWMDVQLTIALWWWAFMWHPKHQENVVQALVERLEGGTED